MKIPTKTDGRVGVALEATRQLRKKNPVRFCKSNCHEKWDQFWREHEINRGFADGKRSEILILCDDKNECNSLNAKIKRATTGLGKEVDFKVISDKALMATFGVVKGPAVVSVSYKLKSEGTDPSLDVIKEWIKEL